MSTRNWNGNTTCCFCSSQETIRHIFFECTYARFLWRAVHMVLGIKPPLNVHNLFDNWYPGKDKTFRSLLLTGAAAICWSIWLIRNEVVFFIEVDQKLFCRFYSGEHIGFSSGHTCNGPRYRRSLFWRLAARWRMRLCVFSLPRMAFYF